LNASSGVLALVLKLRFQLPPAAIKHGFRHPGLDEFQAADIANDNFLVSVNKLARELMQCVVAAARGLTMQALRLSLMPTPLRLRYFSFQASIKLTRS
jgi:hypothetical protein